jgi:triacylglycerol lipase
MRPHRDSGRESRQEREVKRKAIPPPSPALLLFPESDTEYVHFEDAPDHPFDRGTQAFSRVNAWWLADAALLAYWNEGPARPIWARAGFRFELLSKGGAQCHIGSTDDLVIVAFRGTQPNDFNDLLDIALVGRQPWEFGGSVHEGFMAAHALIWPDVEQALTRLDPRRAVTWFTGHSLGAALATLSMDRWPSARGLYTIGSPPVGNGRFAKAFNARHAGRSFRYVNHLDIVVHVAAWLSVLIGNYTHVKLRRYIDAEGTISDGSPSLLDWLSLLRARRLITKAANQMRSGQLTQLPDVLADHTPRRYAVHIWNDYVSSIRR